MRQNMNDTIIKIAKTKDINELLKIYEPYVTNTVVTFEYEVPTIKEFQNRMDKILKKYPYLVPETDGVITEYAYANIFKYPDAYNRCVEATIYIKEDMKGKGIGKKLYTALEKILSFQNILNLNVCITYKDNKYLTKDCINFHKHLLYKTIRQFNKYRHKFNNWYNTICIEKHCIKPPKNRCFKDIEKT